MVAGLVGFDSEGAAEDFDGAGKALVEDEGAGEAAEGGAVGGGVVEDGLVLGLSFIVETAFSEESGEGGAGIVEFRVCGNSFPERGHGMGGIAFVEVGEPEIEMRLTCLAVERGGAGEGLNSAIELFRLGEVGA